MCTKRCNNSCIIDEVFLSLVGLKSMWRARSMFEFSASAKSDAYIIRCLKTSILMNFWLSLSKVEIHSEILIARSKRTFQVPLVQVLKFALAHGCLPALRQIDPWSFSKEDSKEPHLSFCQLTRVDQTS